jgi:hypothetical protein
MIVHDDHLISLEEMRAVLSANEGPPQARSRVRRQRLRLVAPIGVALLLVGVGAFVGVRQWEGSDSRPAARDSALRHVELPPLPPGPTRLEGAGSSAAIMRVSLQDMIADADVVLVGTVTAIGGREEISRDEEGFVLTANRVRYRIQRVLRGDPVDQIDLTNLTLGEAAFPAAVGTEYLVFAEWRRLGGTPQPRLVPSGYYQGVYEVTARDEARNAANGVVSIDAVARRVAASEVD